MPCYYAYDVFLMLMTILNTWQEDQQEPLD